MGAWFFGKVAYSLAGAYGCARQVQGVPSAFQSRGAKGGDFNFSYAGGYGALVGAFFEGAAACLMQWAMSKACVMTGVMAVMPTTTGFVS